MPPYLLILIALSLSTSQGHTTGQEDARMDLRTTSVKRNILQNGAKLKGQGEDTARMVAGQSQEREILWGGCTVYKD